MYVYVEYMCVRERQTKREGERERGRERKRENEREREREYLPPVSSWCRL